MPTTVSQYFLTVSNPHRSTLQLLRTQVRKIAPAAEDCISYGMPALRYNGKILLWYAAAKKHCALYPGGAVIGQLGKELAKYATSKGTIRFTPDQCLPTSLLKKIVNN